MAADPISRDMRDPEHLADGVVLTEDTGYHPHDDGVDVSLLLSSP